MAVPIVAVTAVDLEYDSCQSALDYDYDALFTMSWKGTLEGYDADGEIIVGTSSSYSTIES